MPSSFFSPYEDHLDPTLFGDGTQIRGTVRAGLLSMMYAVLDKYFVGGKSWSRAWIAGSGVSYQWGSNNDLDVLVGVKYEDFRYLNPTYRQMSDLEISKHINEIFRSDLQPHTEDWHGYEVTFYVFSGRRTKVCTCEDSPQKSARGSSTSSCSTCEEEVFLQPFDIRTILPYAAYSLTDDSWTVEPTRNAPSVPAEWEHEASGMQKRAQLAVSRYSEAHTSMVNAPHDAARVSAESAMKHSLAQAADLFHQVHEGRKYAFGPGGSGYSDRHNFLWQAGKRDGWLPALKEMKNYYDTMTAQQHLSTYGVELPDTDVLIRRAAAAYAARSPENAASSYIEQATQQNLM